MPYKKRSPKKTYRRKKRGRKNRAVVQRSIVADKQIVKLRYVEFVTLDAGIGSVAYDTWRANGVFDPYVGVGGHQPLGHDQWAPFYDNYVVLGSKATCFAEVYGTAASDSVWLIGNVGQTIGAPASNINQAIEQNKVKYTFLGGKTSSKSLGKVSIYYSPKAVFGVKDVLDNGDLVGSLGSTDPPAPCYFHFQVGGNNPADNPTSVNCRVLIEYTVMLTGRKELEQS